ncbi:hypothetical protein GCM10018790_55330 [Kitasatospora xanthocidica]|uniref:hypothetical protein n=1 Tax=Kitasatospora xanthocidica TaxID=83382 RepID=UPI0016718A4B|nr:hypothetical protein [Kitasatospora xanthocidica]GHF70327.1 hypothetical protein GCM10018790_55330 [Kitasatospora xanthocidica]
MSLSTIRRTTRTRTLAGTVLAAALLLPAATACSSGSSGSTAAAGSTTAPAATAGTTAPASPAATPVATPGASGAATPPAAGSTPPAAATPSARRTSTPPPAGKATSPARTQTLPDGSTAEIREVAPQHFVAKIVHGGDVLATLEAKEHDAGLDANDMFIVLSLDGTVHAWMGGAHEGTGTFKVAGDWTVKVTKLGELKYRADILGMDNAVYATLETNGHDVGVDANGVYIVLSAGGRVSAHA